MLTKCRATWNHNGLTFSQQLPDWTLNAITLQLPMVLTRRARDLAAGRRRTHARDRRVLFRRKTKSFPVTFVPFSSGLSSSPSLVRARRWQRIGEFADDGMSSK